MICRIIKNEDPSKRFPEEFQPLTTNTPGGNKPHKSDFDCHLYPLLESLIVYGKVLEGGTQALVLEMFKEGIKNRNYVIHAVHALTCCLMEMQDQNIKKVLHEILLRLSQNSATKAMAGPKMAFFSTLVMFPNLYSSWIADQYLCVIGTVIPYANYSDRPTQDQRFDEFTVALAHRVIALWFLNCKVPQRIQLSKYIRTCLMRNIHTINVEDGMARDRAQSVGQNPKRYLLPSFYVIKSLIHTKCLVITLQFVFIVSFVLLF